MDAEIKFDLIVLGGGSGGIASAVRAASYGAKVAVVEKAHLGGTCVNLGCVPKKMMFNASLITENLHRAQDYGYQIEASPLDWQHLVARREHYIQGLRGNYLKRLEKSGIEFIQGNGHFHDKNTIQVNEKLLRADHIIIATGGEPLMPEMPGIEHCISSDGFFALQQQPKKVAIIGSGYIGVELAGLLQGLGSETHLFMRGQYPLARFDHLLGETLLECMKLQGIKVYVDHKAKEIILQKDGRKMIRCPKDSLIGDFDTVIMAVGRAPRTRGLNLEAIGVALDERGLITVDAYQNTTVAGIYAIGDVTLAPALTPVAIAAGRKLSDRLFGNKPQAHLNYENIPSVVFSHPPVGSVGLSEQEAIAVHGQDKIKIYQTRFNPMWDALASTKIPTAMKLVTLGPEEKIIGLHLIGYNSDEMLQGFAVAVRMGACKKDFDATVALHPTSAEEMVTMV